MYSTKVVWVGTVLGDETVENFEKWFLDTLGYHVKYDTEFGMIGEYEGLHCIIFGICGKEVPKFSLFRIQTNDMKWFDDFVENMGRDNFPVEILNKYE